MRVRARATPPYTRRFNTTTTITTLPSLVSVLYIYIYFIGLLCKVSQQQENHLSKEAGPKTHRVNSVLSSHSSFSCVCPRTDYCSSHSAFSSGKHHCTIHRIVHVVQHLHQCPSSPLPLSPTLRLLLRAFLRAAGDGEVSLCHCIHHLLCLCLAFTVLC